MPRPPVRRSRRRVLSQWAALTAGFVLALGTVTPAPVAAQDLDAGATNDVPWPSDPPPPAAAADTPATPVESVEQVVDADQMDDTEPADAPLPVATGPWGVPPVKLTIPALGVEAAVEPVAQDPDGAMSTPTDPDHVAWYRLGPGMGVPGNVVLAAHVNWDGRLRVFGELHVLGAGDVVQIIDAEGRGYEYVVESSHWVRAEGAPLEEIFAQPPEPIITLITCGGEYVASRREYLDRLIVKARGA